MSWLYIFIACVRFSNTFSFFHSCLTQAMYIRWLIFSCDLLSLYPPVYLLSMWLNGIIAITNSNSDSASPWNIPLWIFASAKLFSPAVNFTLQFSMVFSIKFTISSGIFYISGQFIIQLCGTISYAFFKWIYVITRFFASSGSCCGCVD